MTPSEIKPKMKFGHWEVIEYSHTNEHRIKYFLCKCDVCGTQRAVRATALIGGISTSCSRACSNSLTGQKFNRWTVLERDASRRGYYWCQCDCGTRKSVLGSWVKYGLTVHCGDLEKKESRIEQSNIDEPTKRKAHCDIADILQSKGVRFKEKVVFEDCKDIKFLPFNFGAYSKEGCLLGLIDIGGSLHYSARGTQWNTPNRHLKLSKHDYIKQDFCEKNNIPLLIIPYQYFNELEKFLTTSDFWQIITKNFND